MSFLDIFRKHSTPVEDRVSSIESQMKLLRLEWAEVYDKIVHQIDRERKRRKAVLDDLGAEAEKTTSDSPEAVMQEGRLRGIVR